MEMMHMASNNGYIGGNHQPNNYFLMSRQATIHRDRLLQSPRRIIVLSRAKVFLADASGFARAIF